MQNREVGWPCSTASVSRQRRVGAVRQWTRWELQHLSHNQTHKQHQLFFPHKILIIFLIIRTTYTSWGTKKSGCRKMQKESESL